MKYNYNGTTKRKDPFVIISSYFAVYFSNIIKWYRLLLNKI